MFAFIRFQGITRPPDKNPDFREPRSFGFAKRALDNPAAAETGLPGLRRSLGGADLRRRALYYEQLFLINTVFYLFYGSCQHPGMTLLKQQSFPFPREHAHGLSYYLFIGTAANCCQAINLANSGSLASTDSNTTKSGLYLATYSSKCFMF